VRLLSLKRICRWKLVGGFYLRAKKMFILG